MTIDVSDLGLVLVYISWSPSTFVLVLQSMEEAVVSAFDVEKHLSGLVFVNLVASLHLIERDEPIEKLGTDLGAVLVLANFVAATITAHKFTQEWMQLVFGPQLELECVHESDEVLRCLGHPFGSF